MFKKLVIGLLLVVIVVAGLGYFYLGSIVKSAIEVAGPRILGTGVSADTVLISPLGGTGTISNLQIGNPEGFSDGNIMSFGSLDVELDVVSLFSDVIEIKTIKITEPTILYETKITSDNIRTLIANLSSLSSTAPPDESAEAATKKVIIRDFQMLTPMVTVQAGSLSKPIALPDIMLQNIGEPGNAASYVDAATEILSAISKSVLNADLPTLDSLREGAEQRLQEETDKLREQADDKVEELEKQAGDALNQVRDIFN